MALNTANRFSQSLRGGGFLEDPEEKRRREEAERMQARRDALTPEEKSPEELALENEVLKTQAGIAGQTEYSSKKWQGGSGILGLMSPLLNKFGAGGLKTADEYSATQLEGLTKSRDLKSLQTKRVGLDRVRATLAGEDFQTSERMGGQAFQGTAGETETFENLKTGEIVNTIQKRNGTRWITDADNQPTEPIDVSRGWIPYSSPAAGGSGARVERDRVESETADVSIGPFMNNMEFLSEQSADVLRAATGLIDPERVVAKYGLAGENDPFYGQAQQVNQVIQGLTFESAGPLLQQLGIASDTDVRIAFEAAGGEGANINTIVGAYKRTVIPTIIGKARARGNISSADIDKIERKLKGYISKLESTLRGEEAKEISAMSQTERDNEIRAIDKELRALR